ncbi:putative DNA-binding protein (MmcQ/YjbR family) [Chitinivorax tropicus]|uniref:Putative DNA-binding protein (MmcQ/YjbR family) n=1 Tax=Chitinivorax tropicus TaxID=714531 RepID=A0A840MH21_9PROT|nr:MmcQ/YjbR family DNA-binding protein [Chitinivorax tropicus]MBB5017690.1 putative DNA-binding protein (MmcQ/YjbR family) [Chitinivorax tropicus]
MNFADMQSLCQTLPGSERDVKWGDAECHCVAGKMYAIFGLEHTPPRRLSIKVDAERFLELTDQPGIEPAPYLARYHWVMLTTDCPLPGDAIATLIRESHRLIVAKLPAKQRRLLTQAVSEGA